MNDLFLYLAIAVLLLYTIYFLNLYTCRKFKQYENFANTEQPNNNQITTTITQIALPNPNTALIQSQNDIDTKMTNKTFKLSVQIQNMPTYVKGKTDAPNSTNTFYLSVESLMPNCSIQNGSTCLNVFVDNKNCQNKELSTYVQNNTNRLVLLSDTYVNNSATHGIGKNSDFTLINVNNKFYLQNVQTGYYLYLYRSSAKGQTIYGNMNADSVSNVNTIRDMYNTVCNGSIPPKPEIKTETPTTKFVTCNLHIDSAIYLLLTKDISQASPISVNSQIDGKITIDLLQFNMYGNVKQTHSLSSCAFDVKTGKFIEKITNSFGTFFVNLVCIDGSTKLQFNVINNALPTNSETPVVNGENTVKPVTIENNLTAK